MRLLDSSLTIYQQTFLADDLRRFFGSITKLESRGQNVEGTGVADLELSEDLRPERLARLGQMGGGFDVVGIDPSCLLYTSDAADE